MRVVMDLSAKIERESRFWDSRLAESRRDPELYHVAPSDRTDRSIPWLEYLDFPIFVNSILGHIGPLSGKRILDLGAGSGFLSTLLAANGAEVDGVDVSEASLKVARWRADISGVGDRVRFHRMPAEALDFPDGSFDAVCGLFVLHHLDLSVAAPELRRVMKPGSAGAFLETSAESAVLMAARRFLTGRFGINKASSDDEAPLGKIGWRILARAFNDSVSVEQDTLVFFRMGCYLPLMSRRPFSSALRSLDLLAGRVARIRSKSYYCIVKIRRPSNS
jgi:SAM-dependent methyltransferase